MTNPAETDTMAATYGPVVHHEHGVYTARVHERTGGRYLAVHRPLLPSGAGYGSRPEDGRVTRGIALSIARGQWGADVAIDGPAGESYYVGHDMWTVYRVTGGVAPTGERVAAEDLNAWTDFGSVFRVHADGTVSHARDDEADAAVYAPEAVYVDSDPETLDEVPAGWHALRGYTGQHGYRGPIMHESEFLGGRMAEDVLSTPGLYVVVTVETYDDDDTPAGWAVLTMPDA